MITGKSTRELISIKDGKEHMRVTINEGCSEDLQDVLDKAAAKTFGGDNEQRN